jgi:hypothetical protein
MALNGTKQTHVFTLRLQGEEDGEGTVNWRGQLFHAQTGKTRYFAGWPALLPVLLAMLRDSEKQNDSEA